MEFEDLQGLVSEELRPELTRMYAEYRIAGHRADPRAFAIYLHGKGYLSTVTLRDIVTAGAVVLKPHAFIPSALEIEKSTGPRLLGVLGEGGMGVVHLAYDPTLGRFVAVKVLRAEVAAIAEAVGRFRAEARITAQLQHPCIVPLHTVELSDDGGHYSMAVVRGRTLGQLLADVRATYAAGWP